MILKNPRVKDPEFDNSYEGRYFASPDNHNEA